jgi:aarF domain-containing kinase
MQSIEMTPLPPLFRYYQARPLLLARRLVQIATTLGVWLGKRWLDSKRGRSTVMFKKRAAQLRAAIMELGPAFVKIGQAVSSRPDVIPPEFLKELEKLQVG